MKKYFIAIFLLLCGAWNAAVCADGVARIGSAEYATIEEAFAAAVDGDVITLMADATTDTTIWVGTVNVTDTPRSLTLDLNGHNLTSGYTVIKTFVLSHGALYITGQGTISNTYHGQSTSSVTGIEVYGTYEKNGNPRTDLPGSSFTYLSIGDNVTLNASAEDNTSASAITVMQLQNSSINGIGYTTVFDGDNSAAGYGVANGVRVDIRGNVNGQKYGIKVNGTLTCEVKESNIINGVPVAAGDTMYCPFVHIYPSATVTSSASQAKSIAVYASGYARWLIEGSCAAATGIYVKSGDVAVSDATVLSNYTGQAVLAISGHSGITSCGSAIEVENSAGYLGGQFLTVNGEASIASSSSGGAALAEIITATESNETSVITLNGGTFTADNVFVISHISDGDTIATVYGSSSYEGAIVAGGTTNQEALNALLADDVHAVQVTNGDGTTTISILEGAASSGGIGATRVYCYVTQDWWTSDQAAVGIYTYADGEVMNAAWPGVRMTQEEIPGLWSAEINPNIYTHIIFTRMNPSDDGTLDWGAQTANLSVPTSATPVFVITSSTATWTPETVDGYWTAYSETGVYNATQGGDSYSYYLTGSFNGWSLGDALPMDGDSLRITLEAGTHSFKVLPSNVTWDGAMGYNSLNQSCSSEYVVSDEDNNLVVTLSEAGVLNVSVANDMLCVNGGFDYTSTMVHLTTGVSPEGAGYVSHSSGEYPRGATIELEAGINTGGWIFDRWSDSIFDNPRNAYLDKDTTLIAIFSPGEYGLKINGTRVLPGTYTGRVNEGSYIAQFLVTTNLQSGDEIQLINLFHGDNSTWAPTLEEGGVSGNFSSNESALVCNMTGCYNLYIKIAYGQSPDYVYIASGEGCAGDDGLYTYSLVGTFNLFGTEWDIDDTRTEMVQQGDNMYAYTIDSVRLTPNTDYQYKVVSNHAWNVREWPSLEDNYTLSVEDPGVYQVLFLLDPSVGCSATTTYLHEIVEDTPCDPISGACAADGSTNVTWLLCDSILTIGGDGRMADYDEQSNIAPWYQYREQIAEVYVAAGVLNVGDLAFRELPNLRYVDLATTVVSLGNYSFYSCPVLHSLTLPESVTEMGDNTPFGGSTTMTSAVYNSHLFVRLPQDYTGEYTIAEGITRIAPYAFKGCNMLSSVVLPSSVTGQIGASTFEECSALAAVNLPEGITALGEFAFSNCSSLKAVDLPATLVTIGSYCFGECWAVDSIISRATTPPEANGSALSGVNYMIPIYVPAGTTGLYQSADGWSGFTDYREISEAPAGCVIAYGQCGAEGNNLTWVLDCDSVLTVRGTGEMTNYSANSNGQAPWVTYGLQIRDIVIEEGVTKIGAYAFYNAGSYSSGAYNNVQTLTIPSTVNTLENNYFYQCPFHTITINSDSIVGRTTYSSSGNLQNKFGAYVRRYIIGDQVTQIAASAFYNQGADSLESVILPEGLTAIGDWAFGYLEKMDSITLPVSLQSIGADAFYGSGLRSITIPSGVTSIGGQAFQNCNRLSSVTLQEGLTALGTSAFQNCTALPEITIPESMVTINSAAFSGCTALTKVTILSPTWAGETKSSSSTTKQALGGYVRELVLGDQVTALGKYAFAGLDSLRTVTFPGSLTVIGDYAFSACKSLQSVTLPSNLTTIGNYAFNGCTAMNSVGLSEGLVRIGSQAFYQCSGLQRLTLPQSLKAISSTAFYQCTGLTEVTIPSGVDSVGTNLFGACSNLTTLTIQSDYLCSQTYQTTSNLDKVFSTQSQIRKYIIGEGVTSIGNYAFYGAQLQAVELPATLTAIGQGAFGSCSSLTRVTGNAITPPTIAASSTFSRQDTLYVPREAVSAYQQAQYWSSFAKILAITGPIVAEGYCGADEGGANMSWQLTTDGVLIVTGEGEMADYQDSYSRPWIDYKDAIYSVIIEEGVTRLGDNAFYDCGELRSVSLPEGLIEISYQAFAGCTELTEVNIPTTVTEAGSGPFQGCSVSEPLYNGHIFLYMPTSFSGAYSIPEGIQTIGYYSFEYCSGLTSLTIPSSVTSIGGSAFGHCTSLESVNIPEGITYINGYTFTGCTSLSSIEIPASVTTIANEAFSGCRALGNIYCRGAYPPNDNLQNAFTDIDTTILTVFVPSRSISLYREAQGWRNFTNIRGQDDPNRFTMPLSTEWQFIMLPGVFADGGLPVDSITCDSTLTWATYIGTYRAAGQSGWRLYDPADHNGLLYGSDAYLVRANGPGATLTVRVPAQAAAMASASFSYAKYEARHAENANWNFVGNPYPYYYNILGQLTALGITTPITVWNGTGYETLTPGIDSEYMLAPFEPFFIQLPNESEPPVINFSGEYIMY